MSPCFILYSVKSYSEDDVQCHYPAAFLNRSKNNPNFLQFQGQGPHQSNNLFMDVLLDTVRDEIAACLESSFDRIPVKEAQKRLNLKTEKEALAFGKKRNWNLVGGNVYSFTSNTAKPKEPLPSLELAEMAISYARELEMIV